MEVIELGQSIVNGIVEDLASTRLGQFSIKKIDALFWTLEQIGKYSVQEDSKAENRKCVRHANMERPLSWPLFWILLIGLHIFRVVTSMILVKFNKKPIDCEDIVYHFQKWRRSLRSIRFSGLQKIRKQELDMEAENSEAYNTLTRPSKKKRYDDETADELFKELMNHTFSETDDLDSTYEVEVGSSEDDHSSTSSGEEEYESSTKFDDKNQSKHSVEDSVPIESDQPESNQPESNQPELNQPESDQPGLNQPEFTDMLTDPNISTRSDEVTFESTICNLSPEKKNTLEDSVVESPEDSLDFNETTETTKINSNTQSEVCENGKTNLNEYSDPTDKLIAQLVTLNKDGNSWNHTQL